MQSDDEDSSEKNGLVAKDGPAGTEERLEAISFEKSKAEERLKKINQEIEAIYNKRKAREIKKSGEHKESEAIAMARKRIREIDEQIRRIESRRNAGSTFKSDVSKEDRELFGEFEESRRANEKMKKMDIEWETISKEVDDCIAKFQSLRDKVEKHRLEAVKLRDEMNSHKHGAEDFDSINNSEA